MPEPFSWERLDELVDLDPIRLRDEAWAEIQRLRVEKDSWYAEAEKHADWAGFQTNKLREARKVLGAAEAWRDRVSGLILGSHELPLVNAVDEWRATRA